MLENDETYADEVELVEAMSDFGEYAATYFTGESTGENPVLPELKEADVTYLESQKAEIMEDEDSIYYASSLLLKTDTILRHYFTENVEGSAQKGNLYYIDSEGIPAHKLGEEIVTTVERADGESVSIKYNPLSYAYIALTRDSVDESIANLMHAMYLYYQAAQDYRAETGN